LKLKKVLRALGALLCGLPLLVILPRCAFEPSGQVYGGANPKSGAVFCDIEMERHCSTASDRMNGIDIARPFEEGFWVNRSSNIGLDKSPAALQRCGGEWEAVVFKCRFPEGCGPVCLNCGVLGTPDYQDVRQACVTHCKFQDFGSDAFCETPGRVRAASGSNMCFNGACTTSGMANMDWVDPRKITPTPTATPPTPTPPPAFWKTGENVQVSGPTSNTIRKVSGAVDTWDAASSSNGLLMSGDGWVEFSVGANTRFAICGLAIGADSTSPATIDIDFGVFLRGDGMLFVWHLGVEDPGLAPIPFQVGDTIRVEVVGGNQVRYSRNGAPFYMHAAAIAYPIRVDASLYRHDATVEGARSSF
jgi:hypothetical protein